MYWESMKQDLWKGREGEEVILSSDGHNDSPGHCAQYMYCTYTITDMEEKAILQQDVIDVCEVERRKKRLGSERGMDTLLKSNMVIQEVVTDGHTGIAALMSKYLVSIDITQKVLRKTNTNYE